MTEQLCTQTYTCMFINNSVRICTLMCMYTCLHLCMQVCTHTCMGWFPRCLCIHAYILSEHIQEVLHARTGQKWH